jgi:hypothetical protein
MALEDDKCARSLLHRQPWRRGRRAASTWWTRSTARAAASRSGRSWRERLQRGLRDRQRHRPHHRAAHRRHRQRGRDLRARRLQQGPERAGIEVTLITYGDRKADGNEYNPLSKEALARFQADVDTMGDLFVSTVARNRNIKPAAVKATQAATYMGADGVDVGFADAVMAPDEAFRSLLASWADSTTNEECT